MPRGDASTLQEAMGMRFQRPSLLEEALVHRSYLNESPLFPLPSNERLEFLGDAILGFVAGELLFDRFPEMTEGDLTRLRTTLVRREALAGFAASLELGRYLHLSRGEEEGGGRERSTILCAAFEALVGALYLDQGMAATKSFLVKFMEPKIERILRYGLDRNPKSLLQELSQAELQLAPSYRTIGEEGPDHAKEFTVEVSIGAEIYGRGRGPSKQAAEEAAAREALERMQGAQRRD